MMVSENIYTKPATLDEAIHLVSQYGANFKFIAGGTDIMANKYQGNDVTNHFIDITGIEALKGIKIEENYIVIGALTRLDDLKKSKEIKDEFPLLLEAANAVGSPIIRKTATLGGNVLCENRCIFYNQSEWWREAVGYCLKCSGNICIATGGKKACFSEFISDTAPALISMNAQVRLIEPEGERVIALEALYTGDGVNPKTINNTSILKEILLPLSQNYRGAFKKLRLRETLEFTSLTTAVSIDKHDNIRIVLAGVDPKPVLIEGKKGDDKEELIKKAIKGARAVENDMFSRSYRRDMIRVFLNNCFKQIDI
ncbi:MAG: FAD binding domain-containing protein [Bacteroidetes bacterium]|nr:FAD binding domain-containing protein [Bacteroidota bacterium]